MSAFLVTSAALVAAHVPLRWNGARTGQDADIPLRPLTPREAAALWSSTREGQRLAGLVQLTESEVVVRTGAYPVVALAAPGECSDRVTYRTTTYWICSSSWEGYHNVHVIKRAALEQELGRPLTDQDLTPDYLANSVASFSSSRLPLYFATEVGFLTALLSGTVWVLQRIRNPLLVPPLIAGGGVAAFLFVLYYSPAFFDADWFFQRIALEEVVGGRGPLGWSFTALMAVALPLTALCLPLYVLNLVVRGVRRLSGQSSTRVWLGVTGGLLGACSTGLGLEYRRFCMERERASGTLDRLEAALVPSALTVLKADAAMASHGVEFVKAGGLQPAAAGVVQALLSAAPGGDVRIFVPVGDSWHAFLWTNPSFKFGDVRRLAEGNGTRVNDYSVVEGLLRTGKPYRTSFWDYLGADYLAGRAVRDEERRIVAAALIEAGAVNDHGFRWWWQLLLGRARFEASPEARPPHGIRAGGVGRF